MHFLCGGCPRQCYLGNDYILCLSQAVTPVKALLLRCRVPSLSKIKYFFQNSDFMIIYCKYTHFSYTLQYCISLHVKNSTKWFIFVYAEYKNFVISVFYCLKIKQHTGSIRNTLEAATRLIPTPPALRDSSMMVGDPGAGLENSSTDRSLCFMDIVPSNLTE